MCMANLANDVSSVSSKRDVGHTVRHSEAPGKLGSWQSSGKTTMIWQRSSQSADLGRL